MKKIYLIVLGLMLVLGNVSATEKESSFFNPENTWEYFCVDYNYPAKTDELYVSTSKLQLFYVGDEEREEKRYMRFNWKYHHVSPYDSYFLLREENGAYYGYIDQAPDESGRSNEYLKGEFLLYDFNMEVGTSYPVACALQLFTDESTALQPNNCVIGVFSVIKKEIDNKGRRVLTIKTDVPGAPYLYSGSVKIVEGIGPISGESNLASFYFTRYATSSNPQPYFRFFRVLDHDNKVVYLSPREAAAGFVEEKEYEWVYGVLSPDGDISYMKAIFNDLYNFGDQYYRRFICTYQDQPWYEIREGQVFYLRESDNKIFLLHEEDKLGLDYAYYDTLIAESQIYDFGAPDGSELTFYSPEGELTRLITTGVTEVGGDQRRSYTFEGSDGVTCVEGIGIIKGGILPVVNSGFRLPSPDEKDTYVGAALVAVYDGEGNLIFSQEMPSGVETISASDDFTAPSDRIYDLQGRELSEPIPGQPYIKGGHIFL